MKSVYSEVTAFVTKDGSTIRELMHPSVHGNRRQSLAAATVAPGASTQLHRHRTTEEIYHFISGSGRMRLGNEEFSVSPGDTVCIPPGTAHSLHNTGTEPLQLLCSCSPPYSDEDTELL
jgi:mannose-6-phosphate isomerase-like protein (cupin superfamily)